MIYKHEIEINVSEIVRESTATELIDLLDELVTILYEDGFDNIKEHISSVVDSLGELG